MTIEEIMRAVNNWPSDRIDALMGQLEALFNARQDDEERLQGLSD
jgi:hypothetical protein